MVRPGSSLAAAGGLLQFRVGRRRVEGLGVVFLTCLIVVAALAVLSLSQQQLWGVVAQDDMVLQGTRAYYLAESAINEARLDFLRQLNRDDGRPEGWFARVRKALGGSYDGLENQEYLPTLTRLLADPEGYAVQNVRVSFWRQESFSGLDYEKHGIVTFDARVQVPRTTGRLSLAPVHRTYRKAYELKLSLVTAPRPFDRFTLFVRSFPYLGQVKRAYEELQAALAARERTLEQQLTANVAHTVSALHKLVKASQTGVKSIDEARRWARTVRLTEAMRLAGYSRGRIEREVEEQIRERLAQIPISEALLRTIASSNPEVVTSGIPANPVDLASVRFTPFRTDGASLDNPAYVVEPRLASSERDFVFPEIPELPEDPGPQVPSDLIAGLDWPGLTRVISPYRGFRQLFASSLGPYEESLERELRRHERLFRLVPDGWMDTFRNEYLPKLSPGSYEAKAAWVFPNQAAFDAFTRRGQTLVLDGVHVVSGPLNLAGGTFRGGGVVVSNAGVEVGSLRAAGESMLTVVARQNIDCSGSPQAALLAPYGTVRFGGARLTGRAAVFSVPTDEFVIEADPLGDSARPEALWATMSPFSVGTVLLRREAW